MGIFDKTKLKRMISDLNSIMANANDKLKQADYKLANMNKMEFMLLVQTIGKSYLEFANFAHRSGIFQEVFFTDNFVCDWNGNQMMIRDWEDKLTERIHILSDFVTSGVYYEY